MTTDASGPVRPLTGWLILPAIGMVLAPFTLLASLVEYRDVLPVVPAGSRLYGLVIVDIGMTVAFAVFAAITAVLFFGRRAIAPTLFIALLLGESAWLALTVIIFVVGYDVPVVDAGLAGLGRILIASAIWVPYFLVSKRVKNTFTR